MSAYITNLKTHKETQIKNLGWLLRNAKYVRKIEIKHTFSSATECSIVAYLERNDKQLKYEAEYYSYDLCKMFLQRRVFKGVVLIDWLAPEVKEQVL